MRRREFIGALTLGGASSWMAWGRPAAAQIDPKRPITIVVPYGPGSGVDVISRVLADKLSDRLKQPVVVENRPGAGGMLGTSRVVGAKPDGHTLLLMDSSAVVREWFHKNVPFDVMKDIAPVAGISSAPVVLFAKKTFGPNNVQELIALARAEPGKLLTGTPGFGTLHHLALLMFNSLAKVELVNAPYASAGASVNGMLAGDIPMVWAGPFPSMEHVAAGTVKTLGAATLQRIPSLPDIPTIAEQGLDGFDIKVWHGIAAPALTPPDVIAALSREIAAIGVEPDFRKRAQLIGFDPLFLDSSKFGAQIRDDRERFGKIIRASGIVPE